MSRSIDQRLLFVGTLEALSDIHIGGMGITGYADQTLARDGANRFYIPGTSLAGALQAYHKGMAPSEWHHTIQRLWGNSDINHSAESQGGASFITVHNAPVIGNVTSFIKDGIAIDRALGATAEKLKYEMEVIPKGAHFDFKVQIDLPPDCSSKWIECIKLLMSALVSGDVEIGSSVSRGLGRIQLVNARWRDFNFTKKEDMEQYLHYRISQETKSWPTFLSNEIDRPRFGSIILNWRPTGALMVKSAQPQSDLAIGPLRMSGIGNIAFLVIPGSSIKGALRSHAERILRTIRSNDLACLPAQRKQDGTLFLSQLDVDPLINFLFGTSKKATPLEQQQSDQPVVGRAALRILDCYSDTVPDGIPHAKGTNEAGKTRVSTERFKRTTRVAIDRWTGSAKEHALYTVDEPHDINWRPITLEIDWSRIPIDLHQPALALLLLVINDMCRGLIPLGYGVNRGMGDYHITGVSITGLQSVQAIQIEGDPLCDIIQLLPTKRMKALREAWGEYLNGNCTEATETENV